jgi:hypothetical protein
VSERASDEIAQGRLISDASSTEASRTSWQRRLVVYAIIFASGAAGMLIKRPFGMFLYHLAGKSPTSPHEPLQWFMGDEFGLFIIVFACVLHRYSGLPGVPRIERLLHRSAPAAKPPMWRPAIGGALLSLLFFVLSQVYQTLWGTPIPLTGKMSAGGFSPADMLKLAALWPLGVVGSGLSEEVVYRFGFLSILMGILSFIRVGGRSANNATVFWTANILQSFWFGFGHVYEGLVASQSGGMLLQTAIAPQTYSAVVFGVVYRRWGLEAAFIAHMASDILIPIFVVLWGGIHH